VRLHIENVFPADPNTVWDTFNDPDFEARLEASSGVRYELVGESMEGAIEVRRLKCTAKKELPRVIARALGADRLSYTQITRLDRAKNRLEWEVVPMALADKVTAKGLTTIVVKDGQSHRTVDGEITVAIPLVGPAIEKTIVGEVESSYVKAAEVALQVMKQRGAVG
jgi:hypothetical protein